MPTDEILDVSKVSADGKVKLPTYVRKLLDVKDVDEVIWLKEATGDGVILLKQKVAIARRAL